MTRQKAARAIDIETLEKTYSVTPSVDYGVMRGCFDISPDGARIAFSWNRGGNYQIWLVAADGGEPRQLTSGEDAATQPIWTPDSRAVLFSRDRAGDENFNFHRVDIASGEETPLAHNPDGCKRMPSWSPDGSRIAFLSNEGGGAFNVWAMRANDTELRQLTTNTMPCHAAAWSPVDDRIAFLRMAEGGALRMRVGVVDAVTGAERIVAEIGGMSDIVEWTPDARALLVRDDASGVDQIILVDVVSGAKRAVAVTPEEQPGGTLSPDGASASYAVSRDGNYDLFVRDLKSAGDRLLAVHAGMHGGVRFARDARSLVLVFTSAVHPPDLWRVPLDGGAPQQLTRSLPDEIEATSLSDAQPVRYPTFDGREVPALYYAPRDRTARPPAIVYVHGGPTAQHTNLWSPIVQYFASHGFAVLAPNVRGSTGYGVSWRDGALRDWGGADLRDLVAGRDFLATNGLADERRIAVIGPSYGGYLTLMALTQAPDKWAAGVSICGIANLSTLYATTREGDLRPYLVQQIGTPAESPGLYDERSPINFVERVQAPLLLLQGANDPRVPLAEAQQMAQRMRQAERLCELKVYPDEGHGFMKTANRLDAMRTALAFLKRHLAAG